jgi:hypothetical protein
VNPWDDEQGWRWDIDNRIGAAASEKYTVYPDNEHNQHKEEDPGPFDIIPFDPRQEIQGQR